MFADVLKRTQPDFIITVGTSMYLSKAAREANVFHFELLHGWGYEKVPWGWEKFDKDYLPQGILTLDQYSTESFIPLQKNLELLLQVEHPFFRLLKEKNSCIKIEKFSQKSA